MTLFVLYQYLKKEHEGLPVFLHQIAVLQTLYKFPYVSENISQEIGSIALCSWCQLLPWANSAEYRKGKNALF